jgi:hypothetical protein
MAASGATARGAPDSAARFLRRALAEPPSDPSVGADVRLELGLAGVALWQPDAPRVLADAVTSAGSPAQRAVIALRGARASGLAGFFVDALELCRLGLGDGVGVPPEERDRLEAELFFAAVLQAPTHAEMRQRQEEVSRHSPVVGLGAVNLAFQAMCAGQPAETTTALLAPVLAAGVLHSEID